MNAQKRMLTGDRPTGKLHLGHYVGTIKNRLKYQHEYESFFIIADLHMLTTKNSPQDISETDANARDLVLDAISAGIEPEKVTFYLQSAVHEIHEMYTLFQNLVTVTRLERIPSLKEMARGAHIEMPYGLLGYPVLQAADILCVKGNLVPVGKDNIAHVEISREIARRFNSMYGDVFPVPDGLLGEVPTLVGTDGQTKMSKSLSNAIYLSDSRRDVEKKVSAMYTDPNRVHASVPGTVEGNPVFAYHDAFNPKREEIEDLKARYREGRVGDGQAEARDCDQCHAGPDARASIALRSAGHHRASHVRRYRDRAPGDQEDAVRNAKCHGIHGRVEPYPSQDGEPQGETYGRRSKR